MITPYNKLPEDVKAIIESKDDNEDGYKELSRIAKELKEIGWYMDYYLNEEITELRPIKSEVEEWKKKK